MNAITQLASARRKRYAEYQPVFWRPTEDADQVHRPYLAQLVQDHDVITLVSEDAGLITGFLIATIGKAPQVYDADGLTCMIDDFIVTPDPWATTGHHRSAAAEVRDRPRCRTRGSASRGSHRTPRSPKARGAPRMRTVHGLRMMGYLLAAQDPEQTMTRNMPETRRGAQTAGPSPRAPTASRHAQDTAVHSDPPTESRSVQETSPAFATSLGRQPESAGLQQVW